MHVVMVNHGYRPLPPEAADSPALVIDQLAVALARRGVRVTTICGPARARPTAYETVELAPSRAARWGGTSVGGLYSGSASNSVGSAATRSIRAPSPDNSSAIRVWIAVSVPRTLGIAIRSRSRTNSRAWAASRA